MAENVANLTSNADKLGAADISATSAILEQLTSAAINNIEVPIVLLLVL